MVGFSARRCSTTIGAMALLAVGFAALGRADDADEPQGQTTPAAELQPPAEPSDSRPQKVIVLTTGRVILGPIVERPGGYLVHEQFGSVVIPFTQVRLTAIDLPEAYRKLSQSMVAPTAGKHLDLAEWCFNNRLYDSAQIEVKRALQLEPERRDAREFLRKLQRTMETGVHPGARNAHGQLIADSPGTSFPGQAWKSIAQRRQMLRMSESVSVAGLRPETVETFVKEVQPLLINTCLRCHSQTADTEFRLHSVRRGMSGFRILTEQNLSAVLKAIDGRDPHASPLLQATHGLHGGSPRPLFTGAFAEQQQEALRNWVLRAASESPQRTTLAQAEPPRNPSNEPRQQKPVSPESSPREPGPIVQTAASSLDPDSGVSPDSTPRSDPFLERFLDEERPDRFDPQVFNRMMHGHRSDAQHR